MFDEPYTVVIGFPDSNDPKLPLFSLEMKPSDLISKLAKGIAKTLELDLFDFHMYKTDLPIMPRDDRIERMITWLHQHSGDSPVDRELKLEAVFPSEAERLDNEKFHIMVANRKALDLAEGLGDPYFVYKKAVKRAVEGRMSTLALKQSPSEVVQNEWNVADVLGGSDPQIHMGRSNNFPVAIFSPILARLQQRLENLDQVDVEPRDALESVSYIQAATSFPQNERVRETKVHICFENLIGGVPSWQRKINPSGIQSLQPSEIWWAHEFPVIILERKSTLGLGGHAVLQALLDFSHIVSSSKCKEFIDRTVFPVVLIGATANRLEICTAICLAGEVYANQLISIDVSAGVTVAHDSLRLARIFKALSECRVALEMHYSDIRAPNAAQQLGFPSPTLLDPSASLPTINFTHFMDNGVRSTTPLRLGNALTLMYEATIAHQDHRKEVVVKFTSRYNPDAHRLLANARLAPELYFCEQVVGGLYMVVMEQVTGANMYQVQLSTKHPVPTTIVDQVEDAMHRLHQENIVFGDLRTSNIILLEDLSVILVDFDWAGVDGIARYPVTLNTKSSWHEDVQPYGLMKMEHDNWQMQELRKLCKA